MIERDRIECAARIYSSNDDTGRAMGITLLFWPRSMVRCTCPSISGVKPGYSCNCRATQLSGVEYERECRKLQYLGRARTI